MQSGLQQLKDFPQPFWLALFAEGTRFTQAKLLAAQEYAALRGLPIPRNVLIPRTKVNLIKWYYTVLIVCVRFFLSRYLCGRELFRNDRPLNWCSSAPFYGIHFYGNLSFSAFIDSWCNAIILVWGAAWDRAIPFSWTLLHSSLVHIDSQLYKNIKIRNTLFCTSNSFCLLIWT